MNLICLCVLGVATILPLSADNAGRSHNGIRAIQLRCVRQHHYTGRAQGVKVWLQAALIPPSSHQEGGENCHLAITFRVATPAAGTWRCNRKTVVPT